MWDPEILEVDFSAISLLSDEQAAEILNARSIAWDAVDDLAERSFADRGRIALEFQNRQLWRHIGFQSFESWMCSGRGGSRTTKYAALKAINQLSNVPAETLGNIPRCNLETLVGVSSAVRELPEVLEAAKGSEESFTSYLAQNHPQQHIEARKRIKFMVGLSGIAQVEEALAMAIEDGLAGTRDEALVKLAELAMETMRTERLLNSPEFQEAIGAQAVTIQ